jgi:hypothetical protein
VPAVPCRSPRSRQLQALLLARATHTPTPLQP